MLTTERLKELFDYLPEGVLVRRVATSRNTKAGERAGFNSSLGYLQASVDGKTYMLHRLIWQ